MMKSKKQKKTGAPRKSSDGTVFEKEVLNKFSAVSKVIETLPPKDQKLLDLYFTQNKMGADLGDASIILLRQPRPLFRPASIAY